MILVTGATGKLGKNLVDKLLEMGEEVRILAREPAKAELRKGLQIVEGDVLDKRSLERAVQGADTVYHLAAVVDYSAPKEEMWKVNVEGTKNIMEAAAGKKVVVMSSTAVLGHNIKKLPANEDTPYDPTDYYGKTKMEAEKIALGKGAIVVRTSVIYGPHFEKFFFKVFKAIEQGKMPIIGTGENRIQYVNVRDLVDALVLAAEKGRRGEVYMALGDDIKTQRELLGMVARMLGVDAPKKHMSPLAIRLISMFGGRKKAAYLSKMTADRVFDSSKAKRELGYEPKIDYEKGLWEMVQAYKVKKSQQRKK